ncbi:uncharacterized protein N7469_003836 [Penicillium citrinum]|uniref:Uncharacterized protein n=1 Tax=Penicillium citrinum TaxID=5077 RepID=A0A9W9TQM5_PENCI|nr:uncharacterized protein N7469_003836 [Penicillium citrinum]KAJ5234668.1 hypothetical protein N7469_003836 [Penicillium citrinum]
MVDEVRHRHEMKCLAIAGKPSITDYTFDPFVFTLPQWLQVPLELTVAQAGLRERAFKAIHEMKKLMHFRDYRFSFLCPQKARSDWNIHCTSMGRLMNWEEDTFPSSSFLSRDATLAPRPRLPKETVRLRLDAQVYGKFVGAYSSYLDSYFREVLNEYVLWKHQTENLAARLLHHAIYREWRTWWDGEFRKEMNKWEECVQLLEMPLWEDVVDELYLMILDCVEDAEEIADSLCRIGVITGQGKIGDIGATAGIMKESMLESQEITVYLDPNTIDLSLVGESDDYGYGEDIIVAMDPSI